MQTFCESSDDVLKACAEVRKLYPHTPHDETNKVFVPMAKYAESHWDTLSQQARDAYDALVLDDVRQGTARPRCRLTPQPATA